MRDKCGHPTQSPEVAFLCYNSCLLPLGRVMHANNIKMKLFLIFFTFHCGLWDLSSPTWDQPRSTVVKALSLYIGMYNFIYLFLGLLGLPCCLGFFLVGVGGGYSLVMVLQLLMTVASLIVEHRLSNHGTGSLLLRAMWDLPRSGMKPISPALAGRLFTTEPPGKCLPCFFLKYLLIYLAVLGL